MATSGSGRQSGSKGILLNKDDVVLIRIGNQLLNGGRVDSLAVNLLGKDTLSSLGATKFIEGLQNDTPLIKPQEIAKKVMKEWCVRNYGVAYGSVLLEALRDVGEEDVAGLFEEELMGGPQGEDEEDWLPHQQAWKIKCRESPELQARLPPHQPCTKEDAKQCDVSLCIIVSQNDNEHKPVVNMLKPLPEKEKVLLYRDERVDVVFYIGSASVPNPDGGTKHYALAIVQCGQGTAENPMYGPGSRTVTQRCFQLWPDKLKSIAALGITAGTPLHAMTDVAQSTKSNEALRLADVLIARHVLPYDHAKIDEDPAKSHLKTPARKCFSDVIHHSLKCARDAFEEKNKCRRFVEEATSEQREASHVFIGTLFTGNTLINKLGKHRKLVKMATVGPGSVTVPLGCEMEADGILLGARFMSEDDDFPVLLIKGISDFGDGKKAKNLQKVAAYASAEFFYKYALKEIGDVCLRELQAN